jgi:hypothetical protein
MNFYSDIIINDIIDNQPIENIVDSIETFGEECFNTIAKYAHHNIHFKYIYNVLGNTKNIIAFHCLDNDNEFSLKNCPSILVYRKCTYKQASASNPNEIRYYILIACTKRQFRNQGYASKLLDGFIERIKKENENNPACTLKIILSSVEESVLFYESYGFKWTRESITDHSMLMRFEKYDPKKEYFIMEFIISLSP